MESYFNVEHFIVQMEELIFKRVYKIERSSPLRFLYSFNPLFFTNLLDTISKERKNLKSFSTETENL